MKYSNEFLAKCDAAYMNCRCKCNTSLFKPNHHSVDENSKLIMSPSILADCHEKTFWYKNFTLLLIPLSEITDEDANKCAELCGLHREGNKITRTENIIYVENDSYVLSISYNGYICLKKNGLLYNMNMLKVYDFLRTKYDLGFSGYNNGKFITVYSLIEAGIAQNKNEVK